jgi:hypothetical protein
MHLRHTVAVFAVLAATFCASGGQARPDRSWHETSTRMLGSLTFGGLDARDRVPVDVFCDSAGVQIVLYRYTSGGPAEGAVSLQVRSGTGTSNIPARIELDPGQTPPRRMIYGVMPMGAFQAAFSHGPVDVSAVGQTAHLPQVSTRLLTGFREACSRTPG